MLVICCLLSSFLIFFRKKYYWYVLRSSFFFLRLVRLFRLCSLGWWLSDLVFRLDLVSGFLVSLSL